MTASHDEPGDLPGTPSGAAPRMARYGEGPEGRAARRERGVVGPRSGPLDRAGKFLHDTRAEMKRVAWPGPVEVRNTTVITVIAVLFFAAYLWVVDSGFTLIISQLQNLVGWLFGAA